MLSDDISKDMNKTEFNTVIIYDYLNWAVYKHIIINLIEICRNTYRNSIDLY
jgi:hypothetical protein